MRKEKKSEWRLKMMFGMMIEEGGYEDVDTDGDIKEGIWYRWI